MSTTSLNAEQIKSVKGDGFLHNRGTRNFSARVITENGMLKAEQMATLAEAAEKFGNGNITFTVRLTVEVPGIDYENIENFKNFIASSGMETGGTGPKVRPIVACKGTTCVFGLCDTQQLASEIHRRFYEGYRSILLSHKFKIAVGGCPNNCAKPDLNDIGIVGQRIVKIGYDSCRGCQKCGIVEACPMKAASIQQGKITINSDICNNCGRCLNKCPFKIADSFESRFKVYVGGRWGKSVRIGSTLNSLFSKSEALDVVEKSILLFKSKGLPGERFGETCDRLGMDMINKVLISHELIQDKANILNS